MEDLSLKTSKAGGAMRDVEVEEVVHLPAGPIQQQHLWGGGRHLYNLLNPVRRCSCSSGVGQGTQPERGGLGLSKEGLKGVEEQRRRGKEGLKLLLLFVKVKVLSLSTFRIIIFCGFCFLFSAWWGLGGAESTRNVQINQIQKTKPLIAVQRKRYWSIIFALPTLSCQGSSKKEIVLFFKEYFLNKGKGGFRYS